MQGCGSEYKGMQGHVRVCEDVQESVTMCERA